MSLVILDHCWAKTTPNGEPGISVLEHCRNVGCVAQALIQIQKLPPAVRKLLPDEVVTLAALHDVGKVSPGFQQQCAAWRERNAGWFKNRSGFEKNHALVSQVFLEKATANRLRRAAEALGAHHGLVQGPRLPADTGGAAWHQARMELLQELKREFGPLPDRDVPNEAAQWLVAGLTAVADWLASDESRFSQKDGQSIDPAQRRCRAREAVTKLCLGAGSVRHGVTFDLAFADRLQGKTANSLQQHLIGMSDLQPAVYVIEDSMGRGKTEAALWLTYRLMEQGDARGLYFGLPTRVTSDRIHRRVEAFLKNVSPTLEATLVHGQAWLRDIPAISPASSAELGEGEEDSASAVKRWFASARRGLLAPFAVGTVDQALLGVIAAKWFFVRQFGLAGKVVVLDEVHSYDLYTSTLISSLVRCLRELRATPVILSATLTARQKAELLGEDPTSTARESLPYPAITVKRDGHAPYPVPVEKGLGERAERCVRVQHLVVPGFDDVGSVAQQAVRLAEEGRNVVWIRNTVRQAQEAYRQIKGARRGDDYEIGLLHSRFPAFQRQSRPDINALEKLERLNLHEERWLWLLGKPEPPRADVRPKASILVSTQVVEQSVDIDADVLITDLAPTDMLLQRMGRLHRHDRGDRGQPTVYLVVPQPIAEQADSLSVEAIREALGAVGRVYDPYVLLRSWAQWRNTPTISLPREIREILKATYVERTDDPAAWQQLRDELEQRKKSQQGRALNVTDLRGPLGEDTEGFGTRLGQKQMLILMLRWRSAERDRGGNVMELQLLNTKKLRLADYSNFNLYAARLFHANTTPVPAWWAPAKLRERPPKAIAQYFADDVVLGVWNTQTAVVTLDWNSEVRGDKTPQICYRPDLGLWLDRPLALEARQDKDDEEYDDGIL